MDDTDKQRGLFDIEIALRFATRSDTSASGIGFDADLKTDITLEAFHYPSVLRASTTYAAGASNGVRIQARVAVMHGTARLGYVHAYLARNANNELGYYLEYEADNDNTAAAAAAQNFTLASTIHASFQHEDHTPQAGGDTELGITQLSITTTALTPTAAATWTAYSTVAEYTVLDDKAFFIDIHAKPDFSRAPEDGGDRVAIEWHALRVRGAVTTEIWDFVHYPRYIPNFGTDAEDYEWATANMFIVPGGQANDTIRIQARCIQQKASALTTTFNATNTDIKVARLS